MSEILRVYRKKTIMLLVVLSVINFTLFLFSAAPDKEITLTGEALEQYIDSYPAFLEQTAESSRLLATLGLNKSRYALDVLHKSADAYARLEGVTLQSGENQGVVLLLQYRISDLFLLAFLMLIAADFLVERKKGLVGIVRSTIKGRGKLYLQRVVILAFSAILAAILLYGGNLLAMRFSFGGTDMSRCLQSLPEFLKCPYQISIGQYFLVSVAIKAVGCFVAASLFLILITVLEPAPAYIITGLAALLELLAHSLVAPVTSVNFLRYLNLYTILGCEEFFEDCCFINFFGKAVPALDGVFVFLGLLLVFLSAFGFLIHGKRYVPTRKFGEHSFDRLAAFLERHAPQRSLIGWECYKIFVKQGALVILVVVFAMHFSMSAKYPYLYLVDSNEEMWYDTYGGEITEERLAKAENMLFLLNESIERAENTLEMLYQEVPLNEDRINATRAGLAKTTILRDALIPVLENMRGGMEYTRKTGNTVHLIIPFTYELLIQKDEKTRERAAFFILIGIIAAVSGIFVYESENHMKDTVHTAYRGRGQTAALKIGLALCVCVIACVALHLVQLYQIGSSLHYHNLSAPVQSLPFMREFGPYITIRQYLFLIFALRTAVACSVGVVCLVVGRLCSDMVTALGTAAFLFLVPTIFVELFPIGKAYSVIHLLGMAKL